MTGRDAVVLYSMKRALNFAWVLCTDDTAREQVRRIRNYAVLAYLRMVKP